MATLNPYICFDGDTEEAFNFYRSVFGGEFSALMRWKEMPQAPDGKEIPEGEKEKIMHVSLPINENNVLMGNDILDSMKSGFKVGSNHSITIAAETKEEADKLFKGLSEGGKVTMEMQETFWNAYFGMFTDKFGVQWMINHELS